MDKQHKEQLNSADLLIDKIYVGGRSGNASDDPLGPLVGVSNQGGFRYIGTKNEPQLIALTSTLKDPDWPDGLDKENGIYTYFGDNKKPGHALHDTPRFGNLLLRYIFENAHGDRNEREKVPPILIFANTGYWRDVKFLGLAVPGSNDLNSNDDLIAIWKQSKGERFQNYQAKFTVLDTSEIPRKWINEIKAGKPLSSSCPPAWKQWVETGIYKPLKAPRTIEHRRKDEQLPADPLGIHIINTIHEFFKLEPVKFEACAAEIAKLMLKNIASIDLTRPTRDGGRDAVGKFRIGEAASAVLLNFALEAKCYHLSNPVSIKELSRLISRLRHRQFGIIVTTSYVAQQAYMEIKEDQHPIVIISANDIVTLLRNAGYSKDEQLIPWLKSFFPE